MHSFCSRKSPSGNVSYRYSCKRVKWCMYQVDPCCNCLESQQRNVMQLWTRMMNSVRWFGKTSKRQCWVKGGEKNQGTKQCVPFCEKEGKHLLKLSLKDIQNAINSDHSEGKGGSWVDAVQEGKNSAYLFIIFIFSFVCFVFSFYLYFLISCLIFIPLFFS